MVKYDLLGYNSLEDYQETFFQTLLKTGHTYDFFVDWDKVEQNTRNYIVEWGLLNSMTLEKDKNARKELLLRILGEHPKVLKCAPLLLAMRDKSIEVAEISQQIIYRRFDFEKSLSSEQMNDAVLFFDKTGLLDLFGQIKDVYTYIFGVEVGLDSNARKNRSGTFFIKIIDHLLDNVVKILKLKGYNLTYKRERNISEIVSNITKSKVLDFLIMHNGKCVAACEANIYHRTGSKPIEVARAYVALGHMLNDRDLHFIWFSDGPGWNEMKSVFKETIQDIEFILNYTQATKLLGKILIELI